MRKPTLRACFALLLAGCGLSYAQIITTVAGGAWWGSPAGTMPALQAALRFPGALAMDRQGNVYIADSYNLEVMRLSPDGMLTVIAGAGSTGSPAEGAQATSAPLGSVGGVAVDAGGNVYITANGRVQKVSPAGIITTVATGGLAGNRLAMDAAGNLYMGGAGTILKVTPAGVVSTLAKGLWGPGGIAVDSAGNVFATLYNTVIKVAPDGTTTTVAQAGMPADVAVDAGGNLYIADWNGVAKVTPSGVTTKVVGNCASTGLTCPDSDSLDVRAVLVDPNGDLYIGDVNGRRVRKVTPAGIISTVAGNGLPPFFGDGGVATQAALATPAGIALDSAGNLYIADTNNQRVRRVTPAGIISTVAGNGTEGFSGDKGPAASASLSSPTAVAVDAAGNLYIAEGGHYYNYPGRIRKVTPDGNINTIAGGGTGSELNGGSATSLRLGIPQALLLDAAGNLYLADWPDVVYKVTPGGTMTAIAAQLSSPLGLAMDTSGNLYIADSGNHRVRKVTPAGIISTFAGTGTHGYSGDGGQAVNAQLYYPNGLALDVAGNLYIADSGNNRIRKVTPAGIISTVAGASQNGGYRGDTGLATSAFLDEPAGLALDAAGNLYFADSGNSRVRMIGVEKYTGPVQPKPASVMNAADYSQKVAPATWITVKGTNLSSTTRQWNDADFINGKLPVQLDGVRVFVDGMPAYVSYISPTQVNALVGASDMQGGPQVPVEVLTTQGRGDPVAAPADTRYAPALFRYDAEGGKYIVANAPDGTLIGKSGLMPGVVTRPARPGELLSAYGTGFGATNPQIPPGTATFPPAVLTGSAYLQTDDGWIIRPIYAGLIGPGLYQLVFQVPETPDGDYRLSPYVGGGSGSSVWITIQH